MSMQEITFDYNPVDVAVRQAHLMEAAHKFEKLKQSLTRNPPKVPIDFILAGGGVCLSQILLIPGNSCFVDSVRILQNFPFADKSVSEQALRELLAHGRFLSPSESPKTIAATSALTTNRYRAGDNHAYIGNRERSYHLIFPKLTETEYAEMTPDCIQRLRHLEDILVSSYVVVLALEPLTDDSPIG